MIIQKKRLLLLIPIFTLAVLVWKTNERPEAGQHTPLQAPKAAAEPVSLLPEATPEPVEAATQTFLDWEARYRQATPTQQISLLGEGTRLAQEHRVNMEKLIPTDPKRALESAVPMVVRQRLPQEILGLLEERVHGTGRLDVLAVADLGRQVPGVRRFAQVGEKRYEAFVFGWRGQQRTTEQANLVGIAVGKKLALDEKPLREMEVGEKVAAGVEIDSTCPVSGKETSPETATTEELTITEDTPAVQAEGKVVFLCHGGHIRQMADGMIAKEGTTGGAAKPTGPIPSTWTTGAKRVLYIRAAFPDVPADPQSERDSYTMMKDVADFFTDNSYGKLHLATTVTPLVILPKTDAYYRELDTDGSANAVLIDAREAAKRAGYDTANFDLYAVRYSGTGSFSGQAYVGATGTWLKSSSAGVAIHEFGHNLGLWHANFWNASTSSTVGPGNNVEYGHSFDTLGNATGGNNHFNTSFRNILSWLPEANLARVKQNGTYRIYQADQSRLEPGLRYALVMPRDKQREYWGEFRQRFTANYVMTNGLLMQWDSWGDSSSESTTAGSNAGAQLLDTTPGSPDGKSDAAILIGRTYADRAAKIYLTPIAKAGTTPEALDIVVNRGDFPGNQAPTLSLSASSLTAAINAPVTLTATATDPDGDTLAYHWQLGDLRYGRNMSTLSTSWPTAGHYVVQCVASDMKGLTTTQSIGITVGTYTGVTMTGQALDVLGQPIPNVHVYNGLSGASYRGSYTLADGSFAIGNMAGTESLTPRLEGWTFVTNGTTITGTRLPELTITAMDATATEITGDTGTFVISRTGATTAALTVLVQIGGTVNAADYVLSPAGTAVLGQQSFSIPVGQESLSIQVTPNNDTTAEGPETLEMTLVGVAGTTMGTSGTVAAVQIADNDTSLPVITLTSESLPQPEASGQWTLKLKRTGATTNTLTVNWGLTGSATSADFTNYVGTTSIPAGANEHTVSFNGLNDALPEGTEAATISLTNNAAYFRSPSQLSTILEITDDDLPIISLAATDNAGVESTQDPMAFTFTRTGPTTSALTVPYAISGTAQQGVDYAPLAGLATIPVGQSSVTVVVTPMDDAIGEPSQTVIFTLRSDAAYILATSYTATATLTDDDLPMISLRVSDGDCQEGGNTGSFQVLSQATGTGNVTVNYEVQPVAENGVQFSTLTGSLTFAKSNGAANITITPIDDAVLEDALAVRIKLLPSAAYSLSTETEAFLWLRDNDQQQVSVGAFTGITTEATGSYRFIFSREGDTTAALDASVAWLGTAVAGTDYSTPPTVVSFAAGDTRTEITLTGINDADAEGHESIIATLQPGTGYGIKVPTATTWIEDDEAASLTRTLTFSAAASSVSETTGMAILTVNLSAAHTVPVSAYYRIDTGTASGGGVDYALPPGVLTFAAGETSKTISIALHNETTIEADETVVVGLWLAENARLGTTRTHTLTITNDDLSAATNISLTTTTSTSLEASGTANVLVRLSRAATMEVSVDYAVTGGTATATDFTNGTGQVIFAPGQTEKAIPLVITDDSLPEFTETISLSISNPSPVSIELGTPTAHTITITDDDLNTLSIAPQNANGNEENLLAATALVTRTGPLTESLAFNYTVSGTATSGTDYTTLAGTASFASGEASTLISVTPIEDTLVEGTETVILTLGDTAGSGGAGGSGAAPYLVSQINRSATLSILDNENSAPAIAVVWPTGGTTRLPSVSQGLWLEIQTTDDARPAGSTLSTQWTQISGPGTAHFENATAQATGVRFTTAGIYVLNAAVSDSEFTTNSTFNIAVEPVPWTGANVGDGATRPGNFTVNANGSISVTGSGTNLSNNGPTDGFHFAYRSLSGDFDFRSRVVSISNGASTSSRSGISFRTDLTAGAVHATMAMTSNRSSFSYRLAANTTSGSSTSTLNTPRYIRLTRVGSQLRGYHSTDGNTWTQQGAVQTLTGLGTSGYIGFVVNSANTTASVTSVFDTIGLTGPNIAPAVSTIADYSLPLPAVGSASANLSATITDTDGGALESLWARTYGPGSVLVDNTSLGNGTANLDTSGLHTFRITANDTFAKVYNDLLVTVTSPVEISVVNLAPAITEGGPSTAFQLTRTGSTTEEMTVNFTLSGSANPASDYTISGQSVVFPANQASVSVAISALADSVSEGEETVTLSIANGAGYVVGSPDTSTVTIQDSPVGDWRWDSFGLDANTPEISGHLADPDHDGIVNLSEYGLLLNPLNPSDTDLPTQGSTPTDMWLEYRQNKAATDISFTPQWSLDMDLWQTTGLTTQILSEDGQSRSIRVTLPKSAIETRQFLNVKLDVVPEG